MELSKLVEQNPWWKGKEGIQEDSDYIKWSESKIKWIPKEVNEIEKELKPFSLHFIFGPRQVGKTTITKLIIRDLLENGIAPKRIFYFRCDEISDFKELHEVIDAYLTFRRENSIDSSYIILDEITAPREWARSIKFLIDNGTLKKDVLLLTGSTSLLIKNEVELFPGRRGFGKDFYIFPLSFRQFLKIIDPELFQKIQKNKIENLEEKEIIEKCSDLNLYLKELNWHFREYLKCGGFPLAVKSYIETRKIDESVKQAYLSWFKNDLAKVNKSSEIARQIVKVLLTKIPSPVSWEKIAKETEIKSPKTISSYLNTFESLFISIILHYMDVSDGMIKFGKNKKIHFIDPLLYQILSDWCLLKSIDESFLTESVAAAHLSRFAGKVFYWQNKEEVDVVTSNYKGFEVKWSEKIKPKAVIAGKMKQYVTLSKVDFNKDPPVIPLSIFLASLEI